MTIAQQTQKEKAKALFASISKGSVKGLKIATPKIIKVGSVTFVL